MESLDQLKVDGWNSEYESMNKLLYHLKVEKSESIPSRNTYCQPLSLICRRLDKDPDKLVEMDKQSLNKEIKRFLDDYSGSQTANTYKEVLKTFFRENGRNDLDFPHYYRPSRGGGKRVGYIPTLEEAWKMAQFAGSLKARAIVMVFFTTGIRNSTSRALKYGVVSTKDPMLQKFTIRKDLGEGKKDLAIIVYPEMNQNVPGACKNRIPYYVFTPEETTETIKNYLAERLRKNGRIFDEEFLFPSDCRNLSREKRCRTPISIRSMIKIVKTAARRAGIEHWKHVTPHSLRKTFKHILRNQPKSSHLDKEDQEFFMGHIISGIMEDYYDWSKIDEMRKKFSRLKFKPDTRSGKEDFLKKMSDFHGIDYNLVEHAARESYGENPTEEEKRVTLKKLIRKMKKQKVVKVGELQDCLDKGYEVVTSLSNGDIIVQKSLLGEEIKAKDSRERISKNSDDIDKKGGKESEGSHIKGERNLDRSIMRKKLVGKRGQLNLHDFGEGG